jgi:hypothetical protein
MDNGAEPTGYRSSQVLLARSPAEKMLAPAVSSASASTGAPRNTKAAILPRCPRRASSIVGPSSNRARLAGQAGSRQNPLGCLRQRIFLVKRIKPG